MFRLSVLAIIVLSISGCVTAKAMTATSKSIVFEYNRNLTSHDDAVSKAKTHCAKYGKEASLTDTTISPSGNWYTRTFRCE